jgi:hypothetical protein
MVAVSSCCPVCTLTTALTMTTSHTCPRRCSDTYPGAVGICCGRAASALGGIWTPSSVNAWAHASALPALTAATWAYRTLSMPSSAVRVGWHEQAPALRPDRHLVARPQAVVRPHTLGNRQLERARHGCKMGRLWCLFHSARSGNHTTTVEGSLRCCRSEGLRWQRSHPMPLALQMG